LSAFHTLFYRQIYTTEEFIHFLESYYNDDLREYFNKAIYSSLGFDDLFGFDDFNDEPNIFRDIEAPCMIEMTELEHLDLL